jgi:hypothetical protein
MYSCVYGSVLLRPKRPATNKLRLSGSGSGTEKSDTQNSVDNEPLFSPATGGLCNSCTLQGAIQVCTDRSSFDNEGLYSGGSAGPRGGLRGTVQELLAGVH